MTIRLICHTRTTQVATTSDMMLAGARDFPCGFEFTGDQHNARCPRCKGENIQPTEAELDRANEEGRIEHARAHRGLPDAYVPPNCPTGPWRHDD